jgi:hydroxymethylpyrimidine pyrophosphatase-like HAD family hydrolase
MFWQGREIGEAMSLDRDAARIIAGETRQRGEILLVASFDDLFILGEEGPDLRELLSRQHAATRVVGSIDDIPGEINQLTVVYPPKDNTAVEAYTRMWGKTFNVATSGTGLIDISPSSKGDGVLRACAYFDVPLSRTYAFGDDENDVTMFRTVRYPYVMMNAKDDLKRRFPFRCFSVEDTVREILSRG